MLGAIAMLMGVEVFAMPAGILASDFAQEIKGRNFVTEWRMVAKVPVFGRLEATLIADIVSMLRPRMTMYEEIIMRKAEKGDCVYYIASGGCEVDARPRPIALGSGDFFV